MSYTVHVDNMSANTTEADLLNLFNRAGLVLSVSLPANAARGNPKRSGQVNMGSADAAQAAIKMLSGWLLHDSPLALTLIDDPATAVSP